MGSLVWENQEGKKRLQGTKNLAQGLKTVNQAQAAQAPKLRLFGLLHETGPFAKKA
jgi:hypothetical protein